MFSTSKFTHAFPLTYYHTILHFDALTTYSCGKHCFLRYMAPIVHFKCTLNCRLQFVSIWTSLNFWHNYGNGLKLSLYAHKSDLFLFKKIFSKKNCRSQCSLTLTDSPNF